MCTDYGHQRRDEAGLKAVLALTAAIGTCCRPQKEYCRGGWAATADGQQRRLSVLDQTRVFRRGHLEAKYT